MSKPKLIVFASGTPTGGGSGFKNLVFASRRNILRAEIAAVVSNYEKGGVSKLAERLKIPFVYFPAPWTAEHYQKIVRRFDAEFAALSGWLKLVSGLNPKKTFNIHPAPLPSFGGPGMYGRYVHEAVLKAYRAGAVKNSAVSMHFVTEKYDEGPVFFFMPVKIMPDDTPETLGKRVNGVEQKFQPVITNLVVQGEISWDGEHKDSLRVPSGYRYLPGF
ncbi:MAG: formyltransferase family protein [Candidatus Paceibacterota bacterium]